MPASPTRFSRGTRTFSRKTSLRPSPPSIDTIVRIVKPGESIGISRNEMPRCGFAAASVRTRKNPHSAIRASLVQIFCPLTTHSSPWSSAFVRKLARSEPAPGSENPWAQNSSPLIMGGK